MSFVDNKIIDVTKDVKWIGVLDYDIKTFDIVMTTEYGTTYNSYFVNAEKKAVIETVKDNFFDVYINKLNRLTNPSELQYIILNHTEPDHSGSLKQLLDLAPSAIVVGSGSAIRNLEDIVNKPFKSLVVKNGDTLSLGNKTLRFIAAPNLHWPDSIYTFLEEDNTLFTCDSFGAHYCAEDMFSKFDATYIEAFKYYFDVILKPFGKYILKAIDSIKPMEIDCICAGHGPMHKGESIKKALELSEKLAGDYVKITTERQDYKILITYISSYGYTKEAASIIAKGVEESGEVKAEIIDIEEVPVEILDGKITLCDGIIAGSPTINQNTLLPVYKLFAVINPIRDRGKLAGSFGSYGWSGEAPKIILENLKMLKLKIFTGEGAIKFSPANDKKEALLNYGRNYTVTFMAEGDRK